jgi:hypothetical protein
MRQVGEVLTSNTVLRAKDDSFEFFRLTRKSEECCKIRKVLA